MVNLAKLMIGGVLAAGLLGGCASGPSPKPPAPEQTQEPVVTVTWGFREVNYRWRENLTLSQALILFGYQRGDIPDVVSLIHKGQTPINADTFSVLSGQMDLVLEPGDRIVIHPHQ